MAAKVIDDRAIHAVAAGADALGGHHVAEAHHGHLGRAAADVADHAGQRFGDRQAGADGRGLGLGHDPHLAGPGPLHAVEDGPLFHGRNAAGHAHQHPGPQPPAGRLGLAEEVAEHGLAEHEVGDHAAGQRADDGNPLRGAALHLPGHVTDRRAAGEDLAAGLVDGHHRGLIQHEPFARQWPPACWRCPDRPPDRNGSFVAVAGASVLRESVAWDQMRSSRPTMIEMITSGRPCALMVPP